MSSFHLEGCMESVFSQYSDFSAFRHGLLQCMLKRKKKTFPLALPVILAEKKDIPVDSATL